MTLHSAAALLLRVLEGKATPEDAADLLIPPPAIDLATIPRERWPDHIGTPVKLPADLQRYIDGQPTFTRAEIEGMEDRLTAHYQVTAPYYIAIETVPTLDAWLGLDPKSLS